MTPAQSTRPPSNDDGSTRTPLQTESRVWQISYLLIAAVLGFFFVTAVFSGDNIGLSLKLIFIAFLILTVRCWTGALILALLQVNLFYLERSGLYAMNGIGSLLWVFTGAAILVAISRFRTLQDLDKRSALSGIVPLFSVLADSHTKDAERIVGNLRNVGGSLLRSALLRYFLCSRLTWCVSGQLLTSRQTAAISKPSTPIFQMTELSSV